MDAEGPETVYRSRTRGPCSEVSLVLEAVGIRASVHDLGGSWIVVVADRDVPRARAEIAAWRHENRPGPAPAPPPPLIGDARPGIAAYWLVLLGVAVSAGEFAFGRDWYGAGRVDGTAMQAGEWWRAATALTLHADLEHLAANLLFGSVFGWFAAAYLGSGVAWLGILTAATAGNVLNVLVMGTDHRSIGASTAVFAALGLLAAWVRAGRRSGPGWVYRWGPVVAAVALLAYTGAGDENTDVGAHLWGFAAGLAAGALAAFLPRAWLGSRRVQAGAGAAALAALGAAWMRALAT